MWLVQNGYMTIYLLDGQGQAVDYPEVLVSGQNSTFTVQVVVENHMGNTTDCQVLVKTTQDLSSIPVSSSNTTETGGNAEWRRLEEHSHRHPERARLLRGGF